MNSDELVTKVAAHTKGTSGDPLTREDVEQVVKATIKALMDEGQVVDVGGLFEEEQ